MDRQICHSKYRTVPWHRAEKKYRDRLVWQHISADPQVLIRHAAVRQV